MDVPVLDLTSIAMETRAEAVKMLYTMCPLTMTVYTGARVENMRRVVRLLSSSLGQARWLLSYSRPMLVRPQRQ